MAINREMELAAKIDIISRELIKPSSPTPDHRKQLKLSLLDQYAPELYIRVVFFYQNQSQTHPSDPSKSTLRLKKSLSECLTTFYPLAGKLNDHLSVDCDDSGVLFVEAKVDAPLLRALHRAPYEIFGQYLPEVDPFPDYSGQEEGNLGGILSRNEILLAVQISWFECGGNAIGVCLSHKVADFASLVTFMNSWAAINRGESIKFVPDFDIGRNLFPPRDVPFKLPPNEHKGKLGVKRFLFTKEKVMELKELAISSSSSSLVKDPTRVEVVTAFLMNQFIKITRSKKNVNQPSATEMKFLQSVNLRSKIRSLASKNNEFQFGNLAAVAIASFSPPDNENQEDFIDDHYCDLVSLGRTAVRKVDDDFVWNFLVPFMNNLATTSTPGTNQQQSVAETMVPFTSWCRSPAYEVNFGWGNPASFVPAGAPSFPVTMLTSTENEDVIEARIAMFEDEFGLLSDELLSLEFTGLNLSIN